MKATYSITFQTVTPESAEYGDYADHGFQHEDIPYERGDLRDLRRDGYSTCGFHEPQWFTTTDPDTNYHTGEETTYSLHFDGVTPATLQRIGRYLDGKPVLGGRR